MPVASSKPAVATPADMPLTSTSRPAGSSPRASRLGLLDRPTLSDETTFVNIGFYGNDGSGKTNAALGMSREGRTLLIRAEYNAKASAVNSLGGVAANVVPWPDTESEFTIDNLESVYWEIKSDLARDPASWSGITLDSITSGVELLVAKERAANASAGSGKSSKWATDRNDYGPVTHQVGQFLRWYAALPCHFAYTALVRRDSDPDGKVAYSPAVNPALLGVVPQSVTSLVHCEVLPGTSDEDRVYAGWTFQHGKGGVTYRGKDGLHVLPACMLNPSFGRILDYVRGDLTKENDPEIARRAALMAAAKATK